jgi:hypothetical protein
VGNRVPPGGLVKELPGSAEARSEEQLRFSVGRSAKPSRLPAAFGSGAMRTAGVPHRAMPSTSGALLPSVNRRGSISRFAAALRPWERVRLRRETPSRVAGPRLRQTARLEEEPIGAALDDRSRARVALASEGTICWRYEVGRMTGGKVIALNGAVVTPATAMRR